MHMHILIFKENCREIFKKKETIQSLEAIPFYKLYVIYFVTNNHVKIYHNDSFFVTIQSETPP